MPKVRPGVNGTDVHPCSEGGEYACCLQRPWPAGSGCSHMPPSRLPPLPHPCHRCWQLATGSDGERPDGSSCCMPQLWWLRSKVAVSRAGGEGRTGASCTQYSSDLGLSPTGPAQDGRRTCHPSLAAGRAWCWAVPGLVEALEHWQAWLGNADGCKCAGLGLSLMHTPRVGEEQSNGLQLQRYQDSALLLPAL